MCTEAGKIPRFIKQGENLAFITKNSEWNPRVSGKTPIDFTGVMGLLCFLRWVLERLVCVSHIFLGYRLTSLQSTKQKIETNPNNYLLSIFSVSLRYKLHCHTCSKSWCSANRPQSCVSWAFWLLLCMLNIFFALTPSFSFTSKWGLQIQGQPAFSLDMQALGEAAVGRTALVCDGWMLSSVYCSQCTSPGKLMMPGEGMG